MKLKSISCTHNGNRHTVKSLDVFTLRPIKCSWFLILPFQIPLSNPINK